MGLAPISPGPPQRGPGGDVGIRESLVVIAILSFRALSRPISAAVPMECKADNGGEEVDPGTERDKDDIEKARGEDVFVVMGDRPLSEECQ